jgi:hypothetical protein
MTMRIKITNEDTSRSMKVTQRSRNAAGEMVPEKGEQVIPPGKETFGWLYSGRDVQIEEI